MIKKIAFLSVILVTLNSAVFSSDSDSILTTFPDESEKIDANTFGKDTSDKIEAEGWATSEKSCFAKGDNNISIGLSAYPSGIFAAYSYALHECFSVGGALGFNASLRPAEVPNLWVYSIPIALRGAFHPFNLSVLANRIGVRERMDLYVGLDIAYEIDWNKYYDNNAHPDYDKTFPLAPYAGMKYYFKENMYFIIEYSRISYLNAGIGFKF